MSFENKPTRLQPVKGLTIETCQIASSRYGYVRHNASGQFVVNGSNSTMGKVSDLVASVEKHLSAFDWTLSAEEMLKSPDVEKRQQACYEVLPRRPYFHA